MSKRDAGVIVVGCGVSGLTCGVLLAEAGRDVRIWAKDLPPHTTSNVAAAIWEPYKAYPANKVTAWAARAYDVFSDLAGESGTGVSLIDAMEVSRGPLVEPPWSRAVRNFRRVAYAELPYGYQDGYIYQTPVMETGIYLDYLIGRFRAASGRITRREVSSLDEPLHEVDLVVNCSGLGSRALVDDLTLTPIRGQILRVARPDRLDRAYLDDDEQHGLTYIVPRSRDCILGGTAQVGNWSLEPDMDTAQAILERCARLVPELTDLEVLEHRVGLRPGRPTVCLGEEPLPGGKRIIHNYGHGGAGVTLSWGCAEDVLRLAER